MNAERWRRIKEVFEAVRDAPAADRPAAIDSLCAQDQDLRREVESLLRHHDRATGFLEMPTHAARSSISAGSAALESSLPPARLGPYRVERELGRGGMGVVYLARDPSLDRPVALKVLPMAFARDADRLARFEREARVLAAINHPNIATIHSLEQGEDGSRFLVLEFVDGQTLTGRLEQGPVAIDEALHICAQVCRGLEAAHRQGIIHRDLKPENVRITPAGLVKLLDFGLARRDPGHPTRQSASPPVSRARSVATQPGLVLGTPGYMSPEQARGLPVDERTDVFSFGCLLYACLAGAPPFRGETIGDCLASVLKDEPDIARLPAAAPVRVRNLLAHCLVKDAAGRPRDIAVIRRELEAAMLDLRGPAISGMSSAAPFASLVQAPAPPSNNLPRQLSSFVGRVKELGLLRELFAAAPLLTLTGAGGCGKTRLALRLAEEQLDSSPGGVWFVELAAVSDGPLVTAAVSAVLGVKHEPGRSLSDLIAERLQGRTVVLLLDNCEHVLAAVAELAAGLLSRCSTLRIVATSRESLGIDGEHTWRVPSLGLPPGVGSDGTGGEAESDALRSAESVTLFLERAGAAKQGFTVSDQEVATVARICRRLDGIPLAIELAAARVKVLSVEQIHEKLSDRFRLLVGGSRRALERHQTLRAAIDWSYDLLSAEERGVLRRLSVFAGGCTLDAAAAVCGPALSPGDQADEFVLLDILTHLVDKSLVLADDDAQGSERHARYRMLETVRQYSRERLHGAADGARGEAIDTSDRHVRFFLDLAERAEAELVGKQQQQWLDRLAADHENFLAALEWCGTAPAGPTSPATPDYAEAGLRLAGALGRFWSTRGHLTVGRAAVASALARAESGSATPALAKALNAAGSVALLLGDYPAARSHWERALAAHRALNASRAIAGALNNLGLVAENQGDYAAAHRLYSEALQTNRQLGNKAWEAININNLGNVAWNSRDMPGARALYEEALTINRQLGNRAEEARNLNNLGSVAREAGDAHGARQLYREALRLKQELRDKRGIALTLGQLSLVAVLLNDPEAATKLATDAFLMRRELGDRQGIAMALEECAVLANRRGEHSFAARVFGAAEALRNEIGSPLGSGEGTRTDLGRDAARRALGDQAFDAAWQRGIAEGAARLSDEALAWLGRPS